MQKISDQINTKLDKQIIVYLLYFIIIVEIIWYIVSDVDFLSILLMFFLLIAIIINIKSQDKQYKVWIDAKRIISNILHKSEKVSSLEDPNVLSNGLFNIKFTNQLRDLGLDAILICLFIMRNPIENNMPSEISIALNIPRSTLYRNLLKLEELELVKPSNSLSDGRNKVYKITPYGEILLQDINYLLK
ncbi:MAG: hypothetical protein GPJ54_03035 [Candidatus Heimdallarchaeota archaeon]|nr:hypothetical protein [Candidatus Heimdallarchaeota archaeon]